MQWNPEIGAGSGFDALESMRRYAHHCHGNAFDVERLPHHGRITRIAARPVLIAEHHDWRVVLFVLQTEAAAMLQPRSYAGEEVAADLFAAGLLRQLTVPHGNAAGETQRNISDQFLENITVLAQRLEDRFGKRGVPGSGLSAPRIMLAIRHSDVRETLRAAHRQQLHEDSVHHAEDCRIRADAQRQHKHDCERESRRLAQLAQRVAKVPKECVHHFQPCYMQ